MDQAYRRIVSRNATGIGLAVGLYGVSFGAIARANGFSVLQTCALSALMFTGASQFAYVGTLGAGGGAGTGVATALGLGARNALYSLRLARLLDARGIRRAAQAQVVIDESVAMTVAQDDPDAARFAFRRTGLAVFVFWNVFTVVGALGADLIGDPRAFGLDAAAPAAFLALVAPRLRGRRERAVAAGAAAVALVALPLLPAGMPVLLAALPAVVVGLPRPRGQAG